MSPKPANLAQIQAKLAQLRDAPAGTTDADESILALIYQFLIPDDSLKPKDLHWFCSRADQAVVDAATFLIRLHAYNSARVDTWRRFLRVCLSTCPGCVRGLQEVKVSSRHTFFGAFTDTVLENFYCNFSDWELKVVAQALAEAQFIPGVSQKPRRTLAEAPSAVFYHILSNVRILQDDNILDILRHYIPSAPIAGWPTDAPPAGLLLLSMMEDAQVCGWAQKQLATIKITPMPPDRFLPVYADVLGAATSAVNTSAGSVRRAPPGKGSIISFPFSQECQLAWKGYCTLLRHVPKGWLLPSALFAVDVRQVIMGHLSDTGTHFIDVLKSFFLVQSRIGPDTWKGEEESYPLVVFNTIKDNVRYSEILISGHERWALDGLPPYLKCVGDLPVFSDALPAVIQFLCEELQHSRFKEIAPSALETASKIFLAVLPKSPDARDAGEEQAWESLDIHTGKFVDVAFKDHLAEDTWQGARDGARQLIKSALLRDVKNICSAVSQLANPLKPNPPVVPAIREQTWKSVYKTIHNNTDSIGIMFAILAQISHMDTLSGNAFADIVKKSTDPEAAQNAFSRINHALKVFHAGFSDAVSRVLDFSPSDTVLRLLRHPEFAKHAMILMFSPVEVIRQPAQELIGSALDVDSRLDCFRALLVTCPGPSFQGMFQFLEVFAKYTLIVPEACNLSKSLALCLTDIIDAMCSRPDGLLLQNDFLQSIEGGGPTVELAKWWALMTRALSNIFSRTPRWAIYFDSHVMVLWMRDALIFGRDLLAQWKVIEAAALFGVSSSASRKDTLSHAGKKMMDDLQSVLFELARWLRLTDEELLHQSFALLQTILGCFKDNQVMPTENTLQKLKKHIDDARKKDPIRLQTRLDSTRVNRLQDTLSSFTEEEEESDDEIEFISHHVPKPKPARQSRLDAFVKSEPVKRERVSKPIPAKQVHNHKTSRPETKSSNKSFVKSSVSPYFTTDDQKKLDSSVALPKFTRPQPVASSSKRATPTTRSSPTSATLSASSSSSGESEDEGEGNLASLAKLQQRTPTVKKPAERRQVKMLNDIPKQRKNHAMEYVNKREDARRTALRLKPDISSLHRSLLSWDYNHQGAQPPGFGKSLCHVPDKFSDSQHYRRTFEPLLLMECWAQIQQSKDEVQDTFECRIDSKQYTSNWIDIDISITEGVRKDWILMETDVVLVQQPDGKRKFLGKTQAFKANPFKASIQATIRMMVTNNDTGPPIGAMWKVAKVFSLTTLHREYAALMALPYYDFCNTILQPVLSKRPVTDTSEINRTMTSYKLNEPQAKAVLSSLQTDEFSLIQGPPGTGKTSTICALVHIFLSRRPKPATAIHAGRNAGPADKEPTKKILLCAPSNAAIDEITFRLKEGVSGAGHQNSTLKVVRVGAPKSINVSVKDVSLDSLVEQKVNANPEAKSSAKDQNSEIGLLRSELDSVKKSRQAKFDELNELRDNTARRTILEDEIKRLNKQKITLTHQLDKLKDKQKSDFRTMDAISRRYRVEVLQEADIICTTLAGSGHELLEMFEFEMVIIDEAAQAIELSSLIPLKYRCTRVVMVGDPQQLPPTVISQEATKFMYNQSLFVRLQKQRPDAVHLLSIQYRMHPEISRLPSKLFYNGRLMDGPDMAEKTRRPWQAHPRFGTYRFYNVNKGQEEQGSSKSLINRAECQVAVALYNRLRLEFSSFDFEFKVGVVTMYRAQVTELRRAFEKKFGANIQATVDFNTVDGFQGQEKDVIILSCVRAGPGLQKVGFLADIRRMNVALTRAKSSVFVLGHAATLERSDDTWRVIVQDAKSRSLLVDTDVGFFTSNAATKPLPSPKKVDKVLSKTAKPNLPSGLVTPQALAASTRKVSLQDSKPAIPSPTNPVPATDLVPTPSSSETSKKRPAPDDEPPTSAAPIMQNGTDKQKPKGKPLVKRPKPGPSLFIPQKRKPPAPDPGGPSAKRR